MKSTRIRDLLERARGGQDVLRVVGGVIDDAAELGVSRCGYERGRGHRQRHGTGSEQITHTEGLHGITP